ncbi:MAG: sodium:proton antiporter, partial [bacterium]|nr:sodium:proton antiporter [bacterium]
MFQTTIQRITKPRALYVFFAGLLFSVTSAFAEEAGHAAPEVNPVWILPFVILLASIAVLPLLAKHFWEKYYGAIAIGLGLVVVGYYLFGLNYPIKLLHTGHEYISFICLIGSLFIVSGGVLIHIWKPGTPLLNIALLAVGAIIANIFGTTGASALLIRPFIRINRPRLKPYHIVFFIFIVANCGGLLTPIGDPPLFLGYLKGVPFFWLFEHVLPIWVLTVGLILAVFFVIDSRNKTPMTDDPPPKGHGKFEIEGSHNFIFIVMILLAVLFNSHLPIFVPEAIQIAAALLSLKFTSKSIYEKNNFSFGPIKEVALLFVGIFATMIPALQYLELHASQLGVDTPGMFYWMSGVLSSVLDNAPTYLTFLSAAFGLHGANLDFSYHMHWILGLYQGVAHVEPSQLIGTDTVAPFDSVKALPALMVSSAGQVFPAAKSFMYVMAVSVGAVFFGAVTYIGNGPNFMVKSIADELGCETPSFFGYIAKYSLPILIPIFFVVYLIW